MRNFLILLLLGSCGTHDEFENNELIFSQMGIIGVDDRVPVKDTTIYPYCSVGKIGAFGGGTGALISPRLVLTAAHVAKDFASFFYPGNSNGKRILGSYNVSNIIYPQRYIENNCLDKSGMSILESQKWACFSYDFAFLVLEKPILHLPYFKIEPFLKTDELKLQLNAVGYGLDTSSIQKKQNKLCQGYLLNRMISTRDFYYDKKDLRDFSKYVPLIFNDCDGRSGDSGSPLFKVNEGKYTIIGVQVNVFSESKTPEWKTFKGPALENSEWFEQTYRSSTRAIPGQVILHEIENNQELKGMMP